MAATALYLGSDTGTQGDWRGNPNPANNTTAKWGTEGILIVDANGTDQVLSLPSHITMTENGSPAKYTWSTSSTVSRGVRQYDSSSYIAACWYKSGTFGFELPITDGRSHILRVCCLDYDPASRDQTLRIRDGVGGTVLDTQANISGITSSKWFNWLVTGNVFLEVIFNANSNAVVSAILFDCPVAKSSGFFA